MTSHDSVDSKMVWLERSALIHAGACKLRPKEGQHKRFRSGHLSSLLAHTDPNQYARHLDQRTRLQKNLQELFLALLKLQQHTFSIQDSFHRFLALGSPDWRTSPPCRSQGRPA